MVPFSYLAVPSGSVIEVKLLGTALCQCSGDPFCTLRYICTTELTQVRTNHDHAMRELADSYDGLFADRTHHSWCGLWNFIEYCAGAVVGYSCRPIWHI